MQTKIEPVRWSAFLPCELEQVVPEEDGHLVVLQQLAAFGVLTVAAVEDVQRAVILGALQILNVVLHLHLHRVAVIVLATLELLVAVFSLEALQSPLLFGRPAVLAAEQDDGFVGTLKAADELIGAEVAGVDTLHVVLQHNRDEQGEQTGCPVKDTCTLLWR